MMDVSGSMGDEQKEIVRIESFWIDTWLRKQYKGIETRFIIHDAAAREVDRDTFFRTRESGGTMISSAYRLAAEIVERDYPSARCGTSTRFHFSDGDNWSVDDTLLCVDILEEAAACLPRMCSVTGRSTVRTDPASSSRTCESTSAGDDQLITSEINDRDAIVESIREFLGKGK